MRCLRCTHTAEGYAVIPGIGAAGEIRFYCDGCARADRVKMRYWDGRDLDVGGHRDDPELGPSFRTLVFSLADLARLRREDLAVLLDWVDPHDVAAAVAGAPAEFRAPVLAALKPARAKDVMEILGHPDTLRDLDPKEAEARIVELVKKL